MQEKLTNISKMDKYETKLTNWQKLGYVICILFTFRQKIAKKRHFMKNWIKWNQNLKYTQTSFKTILNV